MGKQKHKTVVCSCHKVTKQDMKTAINDGVVKFKDLQEQTKIGTKCSSCKSKNKERFKKYKRKLGV